jgi:ATP-dependent Clp protease ATP-binding subunit ClpB
MTEMHQLFRPEFLNRLDESLLFRRLSRNDMGAIVTIQMTRLQSRLAERGISLSLDDAAQSWLAAQGYDPQFGARPLKRVIQNKVQNPLAEALLAGRFQDGDVIAVGLDQAADRLVFNAAAPLADAG